jgi:hypothetical protein
MGDDTEKTTETTTTTEETHSIPEVERTREEHRISGRPELVDEEITTTVTETTETETEEE